MVLPMVGEYVIAFFKNPLTVMLEDFFCSILFLDALFLDQYQKLGSNLKIRNFEG